MHNIWLSKHPDSTISEQRPTDESNVIMRRNLLTSVEIEEIQRGLSTQACHTKSSTPEQPTSNQPDLTSIEEIPQQQHSLNLRQMALKSRLIAQLQQEHRLQLPAPKNTHRNKDLTQTSIRCYAQSTQPQSKKQTSCCTAQPWWLRRY